MSLDRKSLSLAVSRRPHRLAASQASCIEMSLKRRHFPACDLTGFVSLCAAAGRRRGTCVSVTRCSPMWKHIWPLPQRSLRICRVRITMATGPLFHSNSQLSGQCSNSVKRSILFPPSVSCPASLLGFNMLLSCCMFCFAL